MICFGIILFTNFDAKFIITNFDGCVRQIGVIERTLQPSHTPIQAYTHVENLKLTVPSIPWLEGAFQPYRRLPSLSVETDFPFPVLLTTPC